MEEMEYKAFLKKKERRRKSREKEMKKKKIDYKFKKEGNYAYEQ